MSRAEAETIRREVEAQRLADPEPMHTWFGLTYSAYLVLHRVAIQTMPREWQAKLVALLDEMEETIDTRSFPGSFQVRAKKNGKYVEDPWRDYERGRRRAPLRKKAAP